MSAVEQARSALALADARVRRERHVEVDEVCEALGEALLALLAEVDGSAEDASRECGSCGDEVAVLSSRDRCDGCEALPECVECREPVADGGPAELEHGMCGSCLHHALRSGWEPGL